MQRNKLFTVLLRKYVNCIFIVFINIFWVIVRECLLFVLLIYFHNQREYSFFFPLSIFVCFRMLKTIHLTCAALLTLFTWQPVSTYLFCINCDVSQHVMLCKYLYISSKYMKRLEKVQNCYVVACSEHWNLASFLSQNSEQFITSKQDHSFVVNQTRHSK